MKGKRTRILFGVKRGEDKLTITMTNGKPLVVHERYFQGRGWLEQGRYSRVDHFFRLLKLMD